jgi:hypothetical protein
MKKYLIAAALFVSSSAFAQQTLRQPKPFVFNHYAAEYLKAHPEITCAKFVNDEGTQVYLKQPYAPSCPTLQMDRADMSVTQK